jgi:DNA repair photolyase
MDIKLINTQKVLSPTQIRLADYVINPYRGCEFGCSYCYSQKNKNLKDGNFFSCLGVKINAPAVLTKELRYTNPKRVLLGSTTECFQYQEAKYKISEQILNLLNNFDIPYTILTKSHLIVNNVSQIEKNKNNKIYFTLNHSSDAMIRLFEKKSPAIKERLEALAQIADRKIALRVHIGPFSRIWRNLTMYWLSSQRP